MTPVRKQELDQLREEGLRRYGIIAPLLEEGLTEGEKRHIRRLICSREGLSERTLRRYVAAFRRGGFDALLPRERKDKGSCKAIPPQALELFWSLIITNHLERITVGSAQCKDVAWSPAEQIIDQCQNRPSKNRGKCQCQSFFAGMFAQK